MLGVPRDAGAEFRAISVVLGLGSLEGQEGPSRGWGGVVGLPSHSFPFFGHSFLQAFSIDIIRHKDSMDELFSQRNEIFGTCGEEQKAVLQVSLTDI